MPLSQREVLRKGAEIIRLQLEGKLPQPDFEKPTKPIDPMIKMEQDLISYERSKGFS